MNKLVRQCKAKVEELVNDINKTSQEAAQNGLLDKEKYVIPPHLHDLQEADLPETQRGLVMTEIAQFRERSAKREREKDAGCETRYACLGAPSGPNERVGQTQNQPQASPQLGRAWARVPRVTTTGWVRQGW